MEGARTGHGHVGRNIAVFDVSRDLDDEVGQCGLGQGAVGDSRLDGVGQQRARLCNILRCHVVAVQQGFRMAVIAFLHHVRRIFVSADFREFLRRGGIFTIGERRLRVVVLHLRQEVEHDAVATAKNQHNQRNRPRHNAAVPTALGHFLLTLGLQL